MQRMLVLVVCLGLFGAWSSGQVTTSAISGTVTDATGAVVPGVQVTAVNVETNFTRSATTDESGQYSIKFLPIGSYRVELNAAGFKKFMQTGIVLELSRTARVDPVIEVGNVTETVAVTGDAPMVNTADAVIGQTVNSADILNLPLVNRDVYALLDITAGVESSVSDNAFGFPQQRTVINGSNDNGIGAVGYYLDGGANMGGLRNTGLPHPNPDAVQEIRVLTNGFTAEFGRFASGVVDVVTKSGTNTPHGSLFESFRNDQLNAWDWGSVRKSPLRRNQFGGTLGGPIVRDRMFIFGSYSGLRQRRDDTSNNAVVPTELERQGDFSRSTRRPNDPFNNDVPFPGGLIPLSRFDPVAKRILNESVPLANIANQQYEAHEPHPLNGDELQVKLDYARSATQQIMGSYFMSKNLDVEALNGNLPWSRRRLFSKQQNFNASHTWTKSPTADQPVPDDLHPQHRPAGRTCRRLRSATSVPPTRSRDRRRCRASP